MWCWFYEMPDNVKHSVQMCAGLFAFWAFHRTAGLVTALLVGSTNVALICFIGYLHVTTCHVQSELQGMPRSFTINYPPCWAAYEIARARVQLTCRLAALHIWVAPSSIMIKFRDVALAAWMRKALGHRSEMDMLLQQCMCLGNKLLKIDPDW